MEDRPNLHDGRRQPEADKIEEPEAIETMVPLYRKNYRKLRPIRRVKEARKYRKFQDLPAKDRRKAVERRAEKGILAGLLEDEEIIIENPTIHQKAKRQCEFCFADFPRPLAICPRCGNCQDCGLFSHDPRRQVCVFCGNTLKNVKKVAKKARIRAKSYRKRNRKGL